MRRSVQKSAPSGQSGQSAENSSAACASQTQPSGPNHQVNPKSRSGSRNFVAAKAADKLNRKRCGCSNQNAPYENTIIGRNPGDFLQPISGEILNHFADCWNFEQTLPKMVTRRTRWSTNPGSGWPRGSSLVVQVSGGALTRTSSVASTIKIKSKFSGKLRVDTIFEQGSSPALFFRMSSFWSSRANLVRAQHHVNEIISRHP